MDKVITVFDKEFEVYITEAEIADRVKEIASQMNKELRDTNPVFLPILNGSFFFASDLLRDIDFTYELSFVKISSYEGLQSGPELKMLIGLDESLANRNIIIVEDIVDSGKTIFELKKQLKEIHVSDIKVATLVLKPASLTYPVTPDYVGFEAADEFLIGYGLDFDKKGRHFKDIYKIKAH